MATIKIVADKGSIVYELDAPIDDDRIRLIIADIGYTVQSDKPLEPTPKPLNKKGKNV